MCLSELQEIGVLIPACITLCTCVCDCVYLCDMCACYAWAECCKKHKLQEKYSSGNLIFLHCCVSGLKFTLFFSTFFLPLNFSYLSPDKWGDYLLACIRFTSVYESPLRDKLAFLSEKPTCTCVCVQLFTTPVHVQFILLFF